MRERGRALERRFGPDRVADREALLALGERTLQFVGLRAGRDGRRPRGGDREPPAGATPTS